MKTLLLTSVALLCAGMAQAETATNEVALFDFHGSFSNLSGDPANEDEFNATSVPGLNGQARMRYDSILLEVQGAYSGAVDGEVEGDENVDDGSTSFGVFGHYILGVAAGEVGLGMGLAAGSQYDDDDSSLYTTLSGAYAFGGAMVGAGYGRAAYGEKDSAEPVSFQYLQAAYEFGVIDSGSVRLSGLAGTYEDGDGDSNEFHELEAAFNYDLSDRVGASVGVSGFGFEADAGGAGDNANGVAVTLGLSVALGGAPSAARDSVSFDTPTLHRVLTWSDGVAD